MKISNFPSLLIIVLVSVILVSCTKKEEKSTDLVTFPLKGEIVEIDSSKKRLMVAHEEIPNYMMAMTMPFKVKNPDLFRGLEVGDSITATLAVSRTESWLETITVVGKGEPPDPELVQGAILARMIRTGDTLPDNPLADQDGENVRFSDFKGKAVAVTFIYSRCPLPDFCILMSNQFVKLQKLLAKDKALDGKWQLITISFDPRFDTPKVMKSYGTSYNADFATWTFLTDRDTTGATVMKLADGLGLTYEDDEGGMIAHNLRTIVLDRDGKLVANFKGNEWTVEEVAAEMKKVMR